MCLVSRCRRAALSKPAWWDTGPHSHLRGCNSCLLKWLSLYPPVQFRAPSHRQPNRCTSSVNGCHGPGCIHLRNQTHGKCLTRCRAKALVGGSLVFTTLAYTYLTEGKQVVASNILDDMANNQYITPKFYKCLCTSYAD